ncbi:conserved domain protein [Ruminococcus albus 8]|uniref:Conserved domain protein n=1 Tax=Ruminococcus albus 8 TaxID=246199 RepID=E9SCX3_RUMAL|nr:conserved domain protein [Ruminococcus albus 8]
MTTYIFIISYTDLFFKTNHIIFTKMQDYPEPKSHIMKILIFRTAIAKPTEKCYNL